MRRANDETLESRRRLMRSQRSSPEDLIQRRLVIRPGGVQEWQPPLSGDSVSAESSLVPSEIWIRFSESKQSGFNGFSASADAWDFKQWLETAQKWWSDRAIDVFLVSFDAMSIKKDVFEKLRAMADRNLPWTTRLVTDGKNIASTATLDQILNSSLKEIQVYVAGLGEPTISSRVLGAVKDLNDLRQARKRKHPMITCRLCPCATNSEKMIADLTQWVKQAGIDRMEVVDKAAEEKRLWT